MAEIADHGSDDHNNNQFGDNPKASNSYFGWIYVQRITNNSSNVVHFNNPEKDVSGDIYPGTTEENSCQGYLPLWSYIHRYEITYFNKKLNKETKILMKDLEGEWLVSFYQEGSDEDIREVRPPFTVFSAAMAITFNDNGYEVSELWSGDNLGGIIWLS